MKPQTGGKETDAPFHLLGVLGCELRDGGMAQFSSGAVVEVIGQQVCRDVGERLRELLDTPALSQPDRYSFSGFD